MSPDAPPPPSAGQDPALRRAASRGVAWTLGMGASYLGIAALRGQHDPELAAFLLLLGLAAVPLGWLEARSQAGPWEWARGLPVLVLLPPLLCLLARVQSIYLGQLVRRGGLGPALEGTWRELGRDPVEPVVWAVFLGLPLALASARRATRGSFRVTLWSLLALTAVTCGAAAPVLCAWCDPELLNAAAGGLEGWWIGRGARRSALEGLPRGRVWLLAYLGHPAALRELQSPPDAPRGLEPWLRGLAPAGPEALRRAALAVARRALREAPPEPGWEEASQALFLWTEDPTPARAEAAEAALRLAPPALRPRERALRELADVLRPQPWGASGALARALAALGDPEQVRAEVVDELWGWALTPAFPAPAVNDEAAGSPDPAASRARQRAPGA